MRPYVFSPFAIMNMCYNAALSMAKEGMTGFQDEKRRYAIFLILFILKGGYYGKKSF